jgi:hypothetical protein
VRGRENRWKFAFTTACVREMVFWQLARASNQVRPGVRLATARASGQDLEVVVDTRERGRVPAEVMRVYLRVHGMA